MEVTVQTSTKTFGDLTVTNSLRVVSKRKSSEKNMDKMNKNQRDDSESLLAWLLSNYNAMNLSTERFSKDGPKGYMRLDNQKYVPSKQIYVSAIQNNTKQGDDDTNSYSTVEAHSSCFSSGSFGLAMSTAHTD